MENIKKIAVIAVFGLFLFGFGIAHFLLPDASFSAAERKPLAQMPALSADAVMNGDYFEDAETYLLEQFPLRDAFLDCKRIMDKYIFQMRSSGGYVSADDHLTKLDTTLDETQVQHALSVFNGILEKHPEIANAYYAIVPDKNYYMAEITKQPTLDYDALYALMTGLNAEEIDLRSLLTLGDFYRTDSHWKQENILPIAQALCQAMGVTPADSAGYTAHSLEGFKGVYYELTEKPPAPDTLTYLTNEAILNAKVQRLTDRLEWEPISVYNEAFFGAENTDSYDVFLDGTEMLITIENPDAKSDKHLILFRDSYGSSLAPLLIDSYAKITMIDLRYIKSYALDQVGIDFANADVLFLYSTTMLNSAISAGLS